MTPDAASNPSIFSDLELAAEKATDWLTDLVFPPVCGNCGRVDARFCAACRAELARHPLEIAHRSMMPLDVLFSTGEHKGVLASAVQAFKYEDAKDLCDILAERLVQALGAQDWKFDTVLPVPLYADRLLERGYNQSALLAKRLAQTLEVKVETAWLRRIRNTGQQARLAGSERLQNVAGAFEADPAVKDLSILLVDDVVTTGATLRECAAALRKRNAAAVFGIAVSHPSYSSDSARR